MKEKKSNGILKNKFLALVMATSMVFQTVAPAVAYAQDESEINNETTVEDNLIVDNTQPDEERYSGTVNFNPYDLEFLPTDYVEYENLTKDEIIQLIKDEARKMNRPIITNTSSYVNGEHVGYEGLNVDAFLDSGNINVTISKPYVDLVNNDVINPDKESFYDVEFDFSDEYYETERIYDDTLPVGTVITDQEGQVGINKFTADVVYGESDYVNVRNHIQQENKSKIIRIGTGIAYFTDYEVFNVVGKAGTVGVDGDIKVDQPSLDILNPGDVVPLEFNVRNTGNKLVRIEDEILLSFWIPIRELKEGVEINGRELRIDDFDLKESAVLKDNNGDFVLAVPFEISLIDGELPFYMTDKDGNKIGNYKFVDYDFKNNFDKFYNSIPKTEENLQRYGIQSSDKDNMYNELKDKKNAILFDMNDYTVLDGNKSSLSRETSENRDYDDVYATGDDNVKREFNLVFNKDAGNKFADVIVKVDYNTNAGQAMNQYEVYSELDLLRDELPPLISKVKDKTKRNEFTERNDKLETADELKELKKEVEDYLNSQYVEEDFVWNENNTVLYGLSDKGEEKLKKNNGHLVIPENTVNIRHSAFVQDKYESARRYYDELQMMKEEASRYEDDQGFKEMIEWEEKRFYERYPDFTEEWLNKEDIKITSVDFSKAKSLTTIGDHAFYKNQIQSVKLTNSPKLTIIDQGAFKENQIQTLELNNLPNLTIIEWDAFKDNKIQSLNLSNLTQLTEIGSSAFKDNEIQTLELNNLPQLTKINPSAFKNNNLKTLELNNLPNLKIIESWAFEENQIQTLELSNLPNLTMIEDRAFSYNQIQSLNLTNLPKITNIGRFAFTRNKGMSEYNDIVVVYADDVTYDSITSNNIEMRNGWIVNPVLRDKEFTPYTEDDFIFKNGVIEGFTNKGIQKLIDNKNRLVINQKDIKKYISRIGDDSFSYNQIRSLEIRDLPNLTTFGNRAFYVNQIEDFTVSNIPNNPRIYYAPFHDNPHPQDYYINIIKNNPQN